jgi:hypothetical protein
MKWRRGLTTHCPPTATQHPALPSIQAAAYPAASAINGDRTGGNWGNGPGGWADSTRDAYDDWLEISFTAPKTIDEIRLYT